MTHLTNEFSQFFRDLAANNNRDWFHTNKKRYEKNVKLPFYELMAELIERVKTEDPEVNLEVKNAVFRINRDIRFSKDKSPYKLNVGGVISRGGRKNMQTPGIYVHLEAEKIMIAGGCYRPDKDALTKIRRHIVNHSEEADKLRNSKSFLKHFPEGIGGEKNKILPAEFKPYAADIPFIFNKQYFYHSEYMGEKAVTRNDLVDFIMQHYKAGENWMEFLRAAVDS